MDSISKTSHAQQPVMCELGPMLRLTGLDFEQVIALKQDLTVANPKYAQQKHFAGFASRDVPRHLYGYREPAIGVLDVAPGFGAELHTRYHPKIRGSTTMSPADLGTYQGEIRPEQETALQAMLHRRQGVFVAPCGSGKTDLGIRLIQTRGVRSLVIVHTNELLQQWAERWQTRAGITPKLVGGGRKSVEADAPLTIATVQTLKRRPQLLHEFRETAALVFIDECHHTPATTFTDVLALLNPTYRYGVTATPRRPDGLSCLIHWWIGPVLAKITPDHLEDAGRILRPRVIPVVTSFSVPYDKDIDSYSQLLHGMKQADGSSVGGLVNDEARFNFVVEEIKRVAVDRHHLVLANSVKLCQRLAAAIPGAEHLVGEMTKNQRQDILERAREGTLRVVVATTLADEGLDLPIMDTVWLVTPTRSNVKVQQRVGRVCRPFPGKLQPRVFDFVDPMPVFKSQFKSRFYKVYRKQSDYDRDAIREAMCDSTPMGDSTCSSEARS